MEHYRYAVLAGYWSVSDTHDDYFYINSNNNERSTESSHRVLREALFTTLQKITASGTTPVIIKDNPEISKALFQCSRRNLLPYYNQVCLTPIKEIEAQQQKMNKVFDELAVAFPQLLFIDPKDVMCKDGYCSTELSGVPVYRDEDHLNGIGSRLLGEAYMAEVGTPFKAAQ